MSEDPPGEQDHQNETESPFRPRIYVASLSDYNAGRLHGTWLEADQDPEALLSGISRMLAASSEPIAEEWAIHDYEGFYGVRLSEWEDVAYVSSLARGIAEHGAAFAVWVQHLGSGARDRLDQFDDCFLGKWDSLFAYAEQLLDDMGIPNMLEQAMPEWLHPYVQIDAEAFARDLALGGDVAFVEGDHGGEVFLFTP